MRSSASLLGLLLFTACHRPPAPEAVLAEYSAHLRAGHVEAAYALTTPTYRARHSLSQFALAVARQPLIDPRSARRADPELVITLKAPGTSPVTLEATGGRPLRLSQDPLDLYPTDTPEATLRAFVRAVERRQPERLRALLGSALRERLHTESGADPEQLVRVATEIRARLAQAAGAAPALLEAGPAGMRLLLAEGFVGLLPTPRGWLVTDLP